MTTAFCLFDTALGPIGLAWNERAIVRLQLPEGTPAATKKRLKTDAGTGKELPAAKAPAFVKTAIALLLEHLRTGRVDLGLIGIDLDGVPPFHRQVLEASRGIQPGTTVTYGELAAMIGSPGSARAVGQALGRNPVAIIVPCHRIVAANGRPGGFSAYGGLETKRVLLEIEAPVKTLDADEFATALADGARALKKQDKILGRLITEIGPCAINPGTRGSVFEALACSIVYQQLTGKAAATILGRFQALFPGTGFPTPDAVCRASVASMRGAGLSGAKTAALHDLASKVVSGALPLMGEVRTMRSEEIIRAFTTVRGIGQWTVEMLLIFELGRLDVLPATDYGVRKGWAQVYGKKDLPTPKELDQFCERWQPYRSIGAWYMWRALDGES